MFLLFTELRLGWGLRGGSESQLGRRADIILLHSLYVVNRIDKEKKKEYSSGLTPAPLWRLFYRLADGLEKNKPGKIDRATDREMSHRYRA